MVLRITTWNVNGIRNPFGFQPWRDKRSFEAMFDILEADIVVMQELKIQRKDLRDDMVLVSGWDCYFSLPRHKKGYSGVGIYTRNSACSPIRAEEGITGILEAPNSSTSYRDLPSTEQIGGCPTPSQLADTLVDATNLDSEGRCILLEFPAFVLIGVYSPANRDETRDDFRLSFVNALDARIRNLNALGKRVVLTGDLNVTGDAIDSAHAEEALKKKQTTIEEILSTPARRVFNQLLDGGRVFGERDEGREETVLFDVCRGFHPDRKGMYTCWEQKINARPGNYGSRIDYVLARTSMKSWFCDSNIQEGLMGSDHCPVYAVLKDKIIIDWQEVNIRDIMSAPGTFEQGVRKKEYSLKSIPALSGKLLPEFDKRRSIRDMFGKKPSLPTQNTETSIASSEPPQTAAEMEPPSTPFVSPRKDSSQRSPSDVNKASNTTATLEPRSPQAGETRSVSTSIGKRPAPSEIASPPRAQKRKLSTTPSSTASPVQKGQKSLKGFFKPKHAGAQTDGALPDASMSSNGAISNGQIPAAESMSTAGGTDIRFPSISNAGQTSLIEEEKSRTSTTGEPPSSSAPSQEGDVVDPIVSKESWSKLFAKREPPRCEGHNEPCITLTTKKSGVNCGRAFWMCSRPLGPSGAKERGTQWRCPTFIWNSDLNQ